MGIIYHLKLLHPDYSTIDQKVGLNTICGHLMLAVIYISILSRTYVFENKYVYECVCVVGLGEGENKTYCQDLCKNLTKKTKMEIFNFLQNHYSFFLKYKFALNFSPNNSWYHR